MIASQTCCRAFRRPTGAGIRIDDTDASLDARIVDVAVHGVVVELDRTALGPTLGSTSSSALAGVIWCSGPDAGRRADLTSGRHVVGRSANGPLRTSDPAMAPHHALIEVGPTGALELSDLGVGRPVELDGRTVSAPRRLTFGSRIGVGASVLEVVAPQDRSPRRGRPTPARVRALGGWTVPYHRPPRSRPVVAGQPIAAPLPAPETHGGVGFVGVISLAVSLLGGLALALVLRQPLLFLMVGLGAFGGIVTWIVQWVQAGRGRRARRRLRTDQLAEFEASVEARWAAAADVAGNYPTLIGIVDAATEATEIWARRAAHGDAYVISLGTGDEPWEPPVIRSAGVIDPEVAAIVERFSQLPGVAATIDLSATGAFGVVGDPNAARSLVRSMIVQLGVTTGPADWELLVVAPLDRVDSWAWTAWLPHGCVDGAGAPVSYDEVEARVGSFFAVQANGNGA